MFPAISAMDISALAEAQQQQQQQQQQLQYHQHLVYQDHHHLQQLPQSSYDPQSQAHDAFYTYHYEYDPFAAAATATTAYLHHHHYYPHHYPHDYSAYLPPPPQPPAHPDPASAPPMAAAPPHDPPQQHHHPVVHACPPMNEQPAPLPSSVYHVSPALNPAAAAAVAALSQLTQFAGTMEAAERAVTGKQERRWLHAKSRSQSMLHHRRHRRPRHRTLSHQHGEIPVHPGPGVGVGGRSSYRGGSRRGHVPFKGGGVRGHYHPSKYQIDAPSFHGGGRGRISNGGGRQYLQSVPSRQLLDSSPASVMESSSVPESGTEPDQTSSKATAAATEPTQMLPWHPLLPLAWCDICRVDCNSFEILEQHKNGKRHKKTVQRIQEIEAQQKLMVELEAKFSSNPEIVLQKAEESEFSLSGEMKNIFHQVSEAEIVPCALNNVPSAILSDEILEVNKVVDANEKSAGFAAQDSKVNRDCDISETNIPAQVNEANKVSTASETLSAKTMVTEHNMESEVQSQILTGKSESSKEGSGAEVPRFDTPEVVAPSMEGKTRRPKMDGYGRYAKRHGQKRNIIRFRHGGKRLRSEPVRSRPPVCPKEQPRVCTLCNVMCDRLAVFECHLSGKKHISRIKRFQGQHTVYGPISVYIPPNQPLNYPPQAPEPLFYGLKSHELLQHEAYRLNALHIQGYGLPLGDQTEQGKEADNVAPESPTELGSQHSESKGLSSGGKEATAVEEDSSILANSEVVVVSENGPQLDGIPFLLKIDAEMDASNKNEDLAA